MKNKIKRFFTIILTIIVIILPCLEIESRAFFAVSIILWPIFVLVLLILKIRDFKNNDLRKIGGGMKFNKVEKSKKDKLSEIVENKELNNSSM